MVGEKKNRQRIPDKHRQDRDGRGGCLDSGEQDTTAGTAGRVLSARCLIEAALKEVHVKRRIIGFHAT